MAACMPCVTVNLPLLWATFSSIISHTKKKIDNVSHQWYKILYSDIKEASSMFVEHPVLPQVTFHPPIDLHRGGVLIVDVAIEWKMRGHLIDQILVFHIAVRVSSLQDVAGYHSKALFHNTKHRLVHKLRWAVIYWNDCDIDNTTNLKPVRSYV